MSATRSRMLAAGALAAALTVGYLAQGSFATGIPANKTAASGSETEIIGANNSAVVLSETVKINNPTDLIIDVSAECALITQVTNGANGQTSRAYGQIKFFVTIDGKYVPVSQEDTDHGQVVFCERAQEQQWTDSSQPVFGNDDSQDQLRQYSSTREANAFNWMALNVGETYQGTSDNVHKVELHATWTTSTAGAAVANAIVGNRTMILEPVKAWNREAVTLT
jgi:hypothetical protein